MRAFVVVWGLTFVVNSLACGGDPPLERFEFAETHMATRFRVVFYAPNPSVATKASQAAFAKASELNRIMSDYTSASELMKLCAKAGSGPVPVSPELFRVLEESQRISRLSEGAFDVTVGPAVRLWRRTRRTKILPEPAALAAARDLVGFEKITLDSSAKTVQLAKSGMQIDLGGIAKGFAADEMHKVLKGFGIQQALIAAGGDIVVSEPPPGKPGWRVGITQLGDEDPNVPTLLLKNAAVSTSGDSEQFVEIDGKRYAHIVDPKTGVGLGDIFQVTVVARNGTTSDALATALSVMGAMKGLPLADSMEGVSARFVRKTPQGLEVKVSTRFQESLDK